MERRSNEHRKTGNHQLSYGKKAKSFGWPSDIIKIESIFRV